MIVISLPKPAASIIRPMMERASTVCPSFVTVMCEENRAAASTSFADARACSPFLLTIFAVASRRPSIVLRPAHEIGGACAHIFAARVDRFLHRLVERMFGANVDELDEAWKIGAREHFDLAAFEKREREIARRTAVHVRDDHDAFAEIDGFYGRRD